MDRISGLCDELLVKILLLLPTKVAVSTSVLSKRWERLWMWMPKLEYDDQFYNSEPECKKLRCFLVRSLPLHRAPVIESLRLKLSNSHFKPEVIELLVSVAVSRYVRELDISYSSCPKVSNMLPSNLFTCKSLVILKLDDEILLDVPRMVCLPSLKTLQLQRVTYSNEESLQRLLSFCPVLKELLVDLHDDDDNMGKFTIIVPSLQSLSLYIPYLYAIDGYVIKTPSLKYIKLKDHNSNSHYCLVESMPNLIEAYVDVEFPDIKSLIGSIKSAKRLEICSEVYFSFNSFVYQSTHL